MVHGFGRAMMPRTVTARLYHGRSCRRSNLTAHPFQPANLRTF